MSISKRKGDANRANARKSIGPRTHAGLEKVSQNAVKYGLLGRFRVLKDENQETYDNLVNQLIREEKPVGLLETELVKKLSEHMWLSQRARRYQEAYFEPAEVRTPEQKKNNQGEVDILFAPLALFMRYQTRHDRADERTLKNLLRLRKERLTAERGSVSQKRVERAD